MALIGGSSSKSKTYNTTDNSVIDKRVVADSGAGVQSYDRSVVAQSAPAFNIEVTGGKKTSAVTNITMSDYGAIDRAMEIIGMSQNANARSLDALTKSQANAAALFSQNITEQNAASLSTMTAVADMISKSYADIGDTALTAVEKAFKSADAIAATGLQFVKETQGAYADAASQAQGNKNLVYAALLIAGIVALKVFAK